MNATNLLDGGLILNEFNDKDHDGLPNTLEYQLGLNMNNSEDGGLILTNLNDLDGDKMSNAWEYKMGLQINNSIDGGLILTQFNDKDADGIPNLVEYQNNLNATNKLDASLDKDADGMPNLLEYQTGLNMSNSIDGGLKLTQYNDIDGDGMPNLWEYQNGFNLTNSIDAKKDADFDLVSNLAEYRYGTNPHDFFSVPLFVFNSLDILAILAILVVWLIISHQFIVTYVKRRWLYNSLNAPNYEIAEKINKAGFMTFKSYEKSSKRAKELLDEATLDFDNGLLDNASQKYQLIIDLLPFKGNDVIEAEAIVRLALLNKDQGILSEDNIVFKNIPTQSDDKVLKVFINILSALREETENNFGEAMKIWSKTLKLEGLSIYYEMICLRALTELYFRNWFYNQNDQNEDKLRYHMESWQNEAEKYSEKSELCRIYLLNARYSLVLYKFNEFESYLDECTNIVRDLGITYYTNYVNRMSKELLEDRNRLENLIKSGNFLLPDDKERIMKKYLEKAVLFLKQDDES